MSGKNVITPAQCRAARAWLGWSQDDLAASSSVSSRAILNLERGERTPRPATALALRLAFEANGVVFEPEGGVTLAPWSGSATSSSLGS